MLCGSRQRPTKLALDLRPQRRKKAKALRAQASKASLGWTLCKQRSFMRFEYLKLWLRWYWLPYKEETVLDVSFRWLCFEARLKRLPTKPLQVAQTVTAPQGKNLAIQKRL